MTGYTFANRIDSLLESVGKTRKDLCYSCGIAANSVSAWQTRNSIPSADTAHKIAQFLGVSVEYLLTGQGEKNAPVIHGSGFYIPLLSQKLSAGSGEVQTQEQEAVWLRAPAYLKAYGDKIAAVCVKGDSMQPTFHNGDLVVIDMCGYDGDGVYAICMDGDYFIKRVTLMADIVRISSDNSAYKSWEVAKTSEAVKIIGRVHCALHSYD